MYLFRNIRFIGTHNHGEVCICLIQHNNRMNMIWHYNIFVNFYTRKMTRYFIKSFRSNPSKPIQIVRLSKDAILLMGANRHKIVPI